MCKRGDYQSTRHTKEERKKAREGFKRRVYQYLTDNDINGDFNKDITAIALNTSTLTTISGNFFYNNYSVKHFMTSNRLIPIETAKNIVISINNNAFTYGLTSSIEPSSTEPSTIRHNDVSNKSSNDKGKSTTYFYNNYNDNNPPNLTININFLNCHFNDNGQDYKCLLPAFLPVFPYSLQQLYNPYTF